MLHICFFQTYINHNSRDSRETDKSLLAHWT